jgi:hypothetical protein
MPAGAGGYTTTVSGVVVDRVAGAQKRCGRSVVELHRGGLTARSIDSSDLNQLADDVDRLGVPVVPGFPDTIRMNFAVSG